MLNVNVRTGETLVEICDCTHQRIRWIGTWEVRKLRQREGCGLFPPSDLCISVFSFSFLPPFLILASERSKSQDTRKFPINFCTIHVIYYCSIVYFSVMINVKMLSLGCCFLWAGQRELSSSWD